MLRSILAACSAATLLAGCTSSDAKPNDQSVTASEPKAGNGMGGMGPMMPAAQDSAATREYKQAMMASMQNMPPFTGDADRDFMQQMRVHHQAAIQMSETLLKHGRDQQTRALAQEIIKAQQREIAEIDRWLSSRR
jgi:uncharacterized protein (DUF305 family)